MKITYTCWKCKKENQLETDEEPSCLLEWKTFSSTSEPTVYIVNCPHCGSENKVEA